MPSRKSIERAEAKLAQLRAKGPSWSNNRRIQAVVRDIIRQENALDAQERQGR